MASGSERCGRRARVRPAARADLIVSVDEPPMAISSWPARVAATAAPRWSRAPKTGLPATREPPLCGSSSMNPTSSRFVDGSRSMRSAIALPASPAPYTMVRWPRPWTRGAESSTLRALAASRAPPSSVPTASPSITTSGIDTCGGWPASPKKPASPSRQATPTMPARAAAGIARREPGQVPALSRSAMPKATG